MDKKMTGRLKRLMPTKRKLIQLYAALLYNAQLKGFSSGKIYTGTLKSLCVPGLNCYSCPGAIGACPLGALQNALASSATRLPAYVFGIIILFGLMLGRTICGFLCPFGLIQELLYKIPTTKSAKNRWTRKLSSLKYVILAVLVIGVPLFNALRHYPLPAFCKYICPAGTLEGAVGLLSNPANGQRLSMLGALFTWKFVLMVLILGTAVFVFRCFCRFLCPLGAIYGMFCRVAMIGVRVDRAKCIDCGLCVSSCKMDIRRVGDHECIHCGECIAACPKQAISWTVGTRKITPDGTQRRRTRILAWTAAVLVLAAVLWTVNRAPGGSDPRTVPAEETETGCAVGEKLPDFTAPQYGGGTYRSAGDRGKVLVINFWATWCSPCVRELAYFEQLAEKYPEAVSVVALHSDLVTENVGAWIEREDYELRFALDESGGILSSLGGSSVLPMTVVVDADGIITYNAEGSVTYEKLEELVLAAMNDG